MPINIYSVRNHLESEGWKLVSDTYKNLNTELEMICPNGHTQKHTYSEWRKRPVCELCFAAKTKKIQKNKVPAKEADTRRILALDAATNITGYSIYDNENLVSYGIYRASENKDLTERINEVKKWLQSMIKDYDVDYLGFENIQLQYYGTNHSQYQVTTYNALARLQGVLLDTCFEASIDSGLVYVKEWRKYCGIGEGLGRENKKQQAQDKVKLWYGLDCTQDEADAICIGKYFVGLLKKNGSWGEDI